MLNLNGEVVGMNTSVQRDIQGEDYFAQGIGFAIKFDVLASRFTAMKSGQSSHPTPVSTPGAIATEMPTYLFGPASGQMQGSGDGVWGFDTGVEVMNFIAEVSVTFPNNAGVGSIVLVLADEESPSIQMITISSDATWSHIDGSGKLPDRTYSPFIHSGLAATNHIRIVVKNGKALFFINGSYIEELDLMQSKSYWSVSLLSLTSEDVAPRFSDFAVRQLNRIFGSHSGSIRHDPDDGLIDHHETQVSLREGIIEARFFNPYPSWQGDWSYGFLFRNTPSGNFHAFGIASLSAWYHDLRLGEVNTTQELAEGYSSLISDIVGGSNHIRIVAHGDEGWLFINGTYIEKLDLSGLISPGHALAITNYFSGDGIDGYSTRFEDFTIWSAD